MRMLLTASLAIGCATSSPHVAPRREENVAELIILFDEARFGRDDAALASLWEHLRLSGSPSRGLEATNRVIEALEELAPKGEASAILATDRALLRQENLQDAARSLRRVLHADGELAPSAALRLHSVCLEAFRRAIAAGGTSKKTRRVNECLYAIQDGDAAAYFEPSPARRPPDPPWSELAVRAKSLLGAIPSSHALMEIAQRRSDELEGLLAREGSKLPAAIDVRSLHLPEAAGGLPYDRSPLLQVGATSLKIDGLVLGESAEKVIAAVLAEDQGRRVTVVAPPPLLWWEILDALKMAMRAGALVAELAVAETLKATIPAGDFYSGSPSLRRIAVFPVSIVALGPSQDTAAPPRNLPRGLVYDTRAMQTPKLIITAQNLELQGSTSKDPLAVLRAEKDLLGLRVSIHPDVPYSRVVEQIARIFPIVSAIAIEPLSI